MTRRDFLKTTAGAAAATAVPFIAQAATKDTVNPAKLPRWRGFNLDAKFMQPYQEPFNPTDFDWTREWGFNFVRLPMDYRCWTDASKPYELKEPVLKEVDAAVRYGKERGVHVNIGLHRAPGYTVASPPETMNLWKDEEALKQFCFQWSSFAQRYKGVPSTQVSFDLVNEPANVSVEDYVRVVTAAVKAIYDVDPGRLVIADGRDWGLTPVPELKGLGIAQSTRGYEPFHLTHYKASWAAGSDAWPVPDWPYTKDGMYDKARLKRERIDPWKTLEKQGMGVHVGEWGAFNRTPHAVTLAWMKAFTSLWKEAGWGWALWNLRGSFGVVDSGRDDVLYESFKGHRLDRQMLELLRAA
jgi:endoglucanase